MPVNAARRLWPDSPGLPDPAVHPPRCALLCTNSSRPCTALQSGAQERAWSVHELSSISLGIVAAGSMHTRGFTAVSCARACGCECSDSPAHAGTDLSPILPVLAKVFDQALEGGGAKNINFQDLAADLAQITFDYPFRCSCHPLQCPHVLGSVFGLTEVLGPLAGTPCPCSLLACRSGSALSVNLATRPGLLCTINQTSGHGALCYFVLTIRAISVLEGTALMSPALAAAWRLSSTQLTACS